MAKDKEVSLLEQIEQLEKKVRILREYIEILEAESYSLWIEHLGEREHG